VDDYLSTVGWKQNGKQLPLTHQRNLGIIGGIEGSSNEKNASPDVL
jgi:hypothetical protein